jgi:hypothetical protein
VVEQLDNLIVEDLLARRFATKTLSQAMTCFDVSALEDFYRRISAEDGVRVDAFQRELSGLFGRERSASDLNDYRLSKAPWKKLADEIVPVSKFLHLQNIDCGRIRFPLDARVPDAWIWGDNGGDPTGIEVTIAQGTERFHLARELVNEGIGRGFLGLSDDTAPSEFQLRMANPRVMFTAQAALTAVKEGILRCLSRKNKPQFQGFILLIQAPMNSLSQDRWSAIQGELRIAAAELPFRAIHVISTSSEHPWGLDLKT